MKIKALFLCVILLFLTGCRPSSPAASPALEEPGVITVTDCAGQTVSVGLAPEKVVALSSSFAEIWLLAGGTLAGVTDDAVGERNLGLPEDIAVLGTVKDPGAESVLALQPDLVLLSQDISSHVSLAATLESAGIPCYTAKVETPGDYLKVLEDFTRITGDEASFEKNGTTVEQEIEALLSRLPERSEPPITALFLRAYSSGVKAKAFEHTVCTILEDIGIENIAAREGFPLEDISIEAIIEADPDYILVIPMGDEAAAMSALEDSFLSNPAFAGLYAVQNDRLIMLSKELYHYKPNVRWGEAYETLLEIFYPRIFAAG